MKKSGLISVCILVCLGFQTLQSQQVDTPETPIIDFVTVDPITGHVTITWSMPPTVPPSPEAEEYVIYWFERHPQGEDDLSPVSRPFATINDPTVFTYTFDYDTLMAREPMMPDPRKTSVGYVVAAINRSRPDGLVLTSNEAFRHHSMQLTNIYDSCRSEIMLRWFPYQGWRAYDEPFRPFEKYRIMYISEDSAMPGIELGTRTHWTDTTFLIENVEVNKLHTFYIEAVRSVDGVISQSFASERRTDMPTMPSQVTALSTIYNSDGHAEISFRLDPNPEITGARKYLFSGSSNPASAPVPIAEYYILNDTSLTDPQRQRRTFYYKLDAMHICQGRPHEASSNTATAIWLSIQQNGLKNNLRWDNYLEWDNSDARYEIYRKIGDDGLEQVVETVTQPQLTTFLDDLTGLGIEEITCYWIRATPTARPYSDEYGLSNIVCIKPESEIRIPTAFIPASSGLNAEYKPTFTFPPEEYLFLIYDRNGALVFETRNHEDGWNGKLRNGNTANEGVYTYFIRFKTAVGKVVEKRGTLMLLILP